MIAFVNKQYVEESQACLQISDLSIHRGYGLFDFFRTSNFVPLFLDNYLDRFFKTAGALHLSIDYTREELKGIIRELTKQNQIADAGFKMILTGGYSSDGYTISSPNLIITHQPVQMASQETFDKGIKVILHE